MTEKRFYLKQNHIIDSESKLMNMEQLLSYSEVVVLLNELHEEKQRLQEVIDSRDVEISELGKQRNYLAHENKTLKLKIKILEQVKPIKELPKKY